MDFFDTHIHLQDFNLDCALKLINSDNVKKLLVVCAKACDFEKAIDFLLKIVYNRFNIFRIFSYFI